MILKQQLSQISKVSLEEIVSARPAFYLGAKDDRLVKNKAKEFEKIFARIKIQFINGPHFLLQACPEESARVINEAVEFLMRSHGFNENYSSFCCQSPPKLDK